MQAIATSVTGAVAKVDGLGVRSNQIGKIIQVIDEIARHTNLLALNAAIEASRAGDQGHGFAVVADEVRKLAKRTSQATQEITVMIHSVQEETRSAVSAIQSVTTLVDAGVKTNAETEALLEEIIQSAQDVGEEAMQIASATTEQSAATAEVNRNLERISLITAETANGAQMSTQACRELSNLAHNLDRLVRQFKLDAGGKRNGSGATDWRDGADLQTPGNENPEQAAMDRSPVSSFAVN
jgi:methyl-accepting chemotaxis protein